jgi:hypothetical protein
MVIELLANAICENQRIAEIKIGGIEWKISQYADDTCPFVEDEASMILAFTVIDLFSKSFGLKINRDKSEAMCIGASSNYRHKTNVIK